MQLTPEQYDFLTRPIVTSRVRHVQGQAHLEAWDVRRYLTRIFGYGGWDLETITLDMIERVEHTPDKPGDKTRWTIVYRAQVRLTIKTPTGVVIARYEDVACGDAARQPSLGDAHDLAAKTALSQALKRCAMNLGDQFGLSLYNNGSPAAVVVRSLVCPDGAPVPVVVDAPVTGGELDAGSAPVRTPEQEEERAHVRGMVAGSKADVSVWETPAPMPTVDQVLTINTPELAREMWRVVQGHKMLDEPVGVSEDMAELLCIDRVITWGGLLTAVVEFVKAQGVSPAAVIADPEP